MGMYADLFAIDATECDQLSADPSRSVNFQEWPSLGLEKGWHGLHYLLTGSVWKGELPLAFLIQGGKPLGGEDDPLNSMRMFRPDELSQIDAALSRVSDEQFWNRFDPVRMAREEIYPEIWDEPESDLREEYVGYFHDLKAFIHNAVESGKALHDHHRLEASARLYLRAPPAMRRRLPLPPESWFSRGASLTRSERLKALDAAPRPLVTPSLLNCNFAKVGEEIKALERAGTLAVHLDVMDGHFVPNLSYGAPVIADWRPCTDLPFDAHLMISEPDRYIDDFIKAGCDEILVHIEVLPDPVPLLRRIRNAGCRAGLVLNPPTEVELILPHLDERRQGPRDERDARLRRSGVRALGA